MPATAIADRRTDGSPFVVHDRSFPDVLGDVPRLTRVVRTDAHEGPVYAPDDDALYFTSLPDGEGGSVARMKIATGAHWTFLADTDLHVQSALDIREYTDPHHDATVPQTVILFPVLVVEKVYVGDWFWGRPSVYQLWADLQDLFRRTKPDFDPTLPEVRSAPEATNLAPA